MAAVHSCTGMGVGLLHLELLNDSKTWMVDSLERETHTHTHLFYGTLPGQDNIKGHRRCDGEKGTSALLTLRL